jgi:hypothetical protein
LLKASSTYLSFSKSGTFGHPAARIRVNFHDNLIITFLKIGFSRKDPLEIWISGTFTIRIQTGKIKMNKNPLNGSVTLNALYC